MNLIRAELLKLRTTALWWIFAILLVPIYGVALAYNWLTANVMLSSDYADVDTGMIGEADRAVSGLYTSGQFFGILLVVLLSAILVTNEFFHLTATSTFLTTPRRELVILAKMAVSVVIALTVWLVTTVLSLGFAPFALSTMNQPSHIGESFVWQAIGLNALAFVLWGLLGVGTGVLIRSQIGATLTLSVLYVVGAQVLSGIFVLLGTMWNESVLTFRVVVPTLASDLMVSGQQFPDDPPRWVGALIMLAYAAVFSVVGTLITKERDVG
ncbi:ABC transporter permease [Actinoplanes sp. NEAU-A12]|uniref:ABC transporter permease n=1 Tax=Actinoplanes sandaracinus TaxID=3045177 RepID=A0ABT6WDR2_9ACTN|nr:ABC transporter permease [Actinoplanes sandaracinus]MDI6097872.1 ABC transporter permease [Actinoplanes sandaracinus]